MTWKKNYTAVNSKARKVNVLIGCVWVAAWQHFVGEETYSGNAKSRETETVKHGAFCCFSQLGYKDPGTQGWKRKWMVWEEMKGDESGWSFVQGEECKKTWVEPELCREL